MTLVSHQIKEDINEVTLMEQTLDPENTLLSVFPHEIHNERYFIVLVNKTISPTIIIIKKLRYLFVFMWVE